MTATKAKMTRPARESFARELAAQAWCTAKNESKKMDSDLAEAFAQILLREAFSANLGHATTRELLNELGGRLEIDGPGLDYKPVDDIDAEKPSLGVCWLCDKLTKLGDGGFWLCLTCQKELVREKDQKTTQGMPPDRP